MTLKFRFPLESTFQGLELQVCANHTCFICDAEDESWGFAHVRRALCNLSYTPAPPVDEC